MKNKNDMVEQEDFRYYVTAEDIKMIAEKSGLTTQNIQSIIKGRTRRSKAMPLIIEVANMRREAARRVAREIVNS